MKTPHFGANPDVCVRQETLRRAAKGEIYSPTAYNTVQTAAGKKFGERIETPDTTFPSDRMLQNLVKELKHQTQFSLQTECCKIW